MNTFVLIKQVPDTETKITIAGGGKGIEQGGIKWILNPYDEFAVEEALKIKEKLKAGTVTVVTAGPDRTIEALRTGIAMGADNAIHIKCGDEADGFIVAKALAEVCKKENAGLILCGKQAIDDDMGATFGYVAEFLNWPSASIIVKCDLSADLKSAKLEREVEGGSKHIIDTPLPAVIAVQKGINTPRYASLPGIMKAKKKEIKTYALADLGLGSETARTQIGDYKLPPEKPPGKKITGDAAAQAKELVKLLREEAKVI
jgi:electron transfer flavoprotein beta subunit